MISLNMALAYAIKRTISSSSFLLYKVGATSKCSSICGNILNKKLSIAEELNIPDPPSKPQQPFLKFMSMGHKQLTNLTWSERIQKLSAAWNNQTQEEKTRRLAEYLEEKKEYQQKYHQYLSQLSPKQLESIKCVQERREQSKETVVAKREKKKELESLGKPKVPENCFIVYACKLSRPDNMVRKEFLVYAASKWKELPDNEKNHYKIESRVRSEKYKTDLAEWENKMLAAGRSELVRRRTYRVFQASDNEGQLIQTSRSNNDDIDSSKLAQSITNVRRERVDSGQESSLTKTEIRERARERAASTIPIPDDFHSTSSSDTIISKSSAGAAKTRASGINASVDQKMLQTKYSNNDSALFRNSYSGTRGELGGTPQGYATLGSRRPAQQHNAMFADTFPED